MQQYFKKIPRNTVRGGKKHSKNKSSRQNNDLEDLLNAY